MITILTGITKITLLKYAFGYSCFMQFFSLLIPDNTQAGDLVHSLVSAIPSQIAGYLGVIYGIAIVIKKISEVWKFNQLDRFDVKNAREVFEQKEIETEIKRRNS